MLPAEHRGWAARLPHPAQE